MQDTTPLSTCAATNRSGHSCRRSPAPGRARCHNHGGAPGSGAQSGNANALKHGFYSRRDRAYAADALPLGVCAEIGLLRAVLVRAVESSQPHTVAMLVGTLARLVKAQRTLDTEPKQKKRDPWDWDPLPKPADEELHFEPWQPRTD
jgi:hypothetical protein